VVDQPVPGNPVDPPVEVPDIVELVLVGNNRLGDVLRPLRVTESAADVAKDFVSVSISKSFNHDDGIIDDTFTKDTSTSVHLYMTNERGEKTKWVDVPAPAEHLQRPRSPHYRGKPVIQVRENTDRLRSLVAGD